MTKSLLQDLFENDEELWLEKTVEALREGRITEIDHVNLSVYLAEMADEKRAIMSYLKQVIAHLLNLNYSGTSRDAAHWSGELIGFRQSLGDYIAPKSKPNRNLTAFAQTSIPTAYALASRIFAKKFPDASIPDRCPFRWDQIVDEEFHFLMAAEK